MKKQFPIKYTSKDFDSIKADLVEYAKRYYSNNFKDFSEAGFASLMMDSVAYAGDILSFYIDYQTNETFLNTAIEQRNIYKIAKQLGYKNKVNSTSSGVISIFLLLPANSAGTAPDFSYAPIIRKGSIFRSNSGAQFILNEDVVVSSTNLPVSPIVAQVNAETGSPTFYAVKTYGKIISGVFGQEKINVGNFVKFPKFKLSDRSITEIISVKDSEGNEYFEVDYLTQNIVYKSILNKNSDASETPNLLIPYNVARRFIVEYETDAIYLRFGGGKYDPEEQLRPDLIAEPSKNIINLYGNDYTSDASLDPNILVTGDKTGVAPENTILTINYRYNDTTSINVASNELTSISLLNINFLNEEALNQNTAQQVANSLQVTNEEPITSGFSLDDIETMKINIANNFHMQNRIVTTQDYETACYVMSPKYGSIKRARAFKDLDSLRNNVNLYVVSEDSNLNFVKANITTKQNLKTWLNQNKVMTDTIDIFDAKIINFGINYKILVDPNYNSIVVLNAAKAAITAFYQQKPQIGQPIYYTDIYRELRKIAGILDVKDVEIITKTGSNYSNINFDIDSNTSSDGRYINIPLNAIFEIKFPNLDIKGAIV